MHVVRLATIHPALAHFTLGGLPLMVLAYALALWRRSPAWTLVGDAATCVTAAATIGTGIFGLVSNAVVPWPGGIERWRWLHLGLGVATTVALLALALWRIWARRPEVATGAGTLVGALVAVGLAGATGWIGGEVLVFHAGMAVDAAGQGALAPPVGDEAAHPVGFLPAMRQARAAWGSMQARLAFMLVQQPSDADFARLRADAKRLQEVAGLMADAGSKDPDKKRADILASMSQTLAGDGADLEEAAQKKSLQDFAQALGEASGHCADCHEQLRWKRTGAGGP